MGPMCWGSVPCLFFKPTSAEASTGDAIEHLANSLVTVRYMFFDDFDVRYFSALQLWTERGRSGYIEEPLGLYGYFKATYDGRVNPSDSIGITLYKRVYPRIVWA